MAVLVPLNKEKHATVAPTNRTQHCTMSGSDRSIMLLFVLSAGLADGDCVVLMSSCVSRSHLMATWQSRCRLRIHPVLAFQHTIVPPNGLKFALKTADRKLHQHSFLASLACCVGVQELIGQISTDVGGGLTELLAGIGVIWRSLAAATNPPRASTLPCDMLAFFPRGGSGGRSTPVA